jgi:hypothetical protein
MRKFAIAIYDNFTCKNSIYIIEANGGVDAMVGAIIAHTRPEDRSEEFMLTWFDELRKMDIDGIKNALINCDQCIEIEKI